jgi:hypothetical protein
MWKLYVAAIISKTNGTMSQIMNVSGMFAITDYWDDNTPPILSENDIDNAKTYISKTFSCQKTDIVIVYMTFVKAS